ncbi:hypothetical protein GCM10010420_35420 [Streptomyces glaucosporus]|uniref:Secreted protein n=1 Tax=Streptomyces glaucosporus TaxID=284044 RepID=A0ABN3IHR1_9ACTN
MTPDLRRVPASSRAACGLVLVLTALLALFCARPTASPDPGDGTAVPSASAVLHSSAPASAGPAQAVAAGDDDGAPLCSGRDGGVEPQAPPGGGSGDLTTPSVARDRTAHVTPDVHADRRSGGVPPAHAPPSHTVLRI